MSFEHNGGNDYASCAEWVACVQRRSGTLTIITQKPGNGDPNGLVGVTGALSNVTFAITASPTLKLLITPGAGNLEHLGWIIVDGYQYT